jgi:tetraacyldisaccharide 4'-kinase
MQQPHKAHVPVISVGNVVIGGAGKTPLVISICHLLQSKGMKPVVITRGYGGKIKGPAWILKTHQAKDIGDEACLFSQAGIQAIVASRRVDALSLLREQTCDVIVLDDGHQQRSLLIDYAILVVDRTQQFGNGCVLPAGPLRESLKRAWGRASSIVIMDFEGQERVNGLLSMPIIAKTLLFKSFPQCTSTLPSSTRVVGFCGIGYPDKFRQTLGALGYDVADFLFFPDHHPYHARDMSFLRSRAQTLNATLITTEKDLTRWPGDKEGIATIKLKMTWPDDAFEQHLIKHLSLNSREN